jgi:hypothetical protein
MEELINKIDAQQAKIDAIYVSMEKMRKYFFWMLVLTVVTVVLPIIIMIVAVPFILSTLSSAYGGLL